LVEGFAALFLFPSTALGILSLPWPGDGPAPLAAVLGGILRELLSKSGNVFVGGRPVRVACITVEHQRTGLQRFFEFFPTECNCLVVVVRTNDFEINAVAHEPPTDRAIRFRACANSLSILDGSAG
jgi:hypothetical protein